MRILAIESSCDESAAAWLHVGRGGRYQLEHVVTTQAIHAKYGGVVPEVAAREHAVTLPLVLAELGRRVVGSDDGRLLGRRVDAIAVTRGPGLVTSLRVGVDTARTLALAWGKPIVGVNHIEGHIYSNWLGGDRLPTVAFPALVLVVSGGHSELLLMRGHGKYTLFGATLDDAAGEAFDKTAKLLGLGYPGGPAISRLAADGRRDALDFPRPLLHDGTSNFSFSGLKTAVRYFIDKHRAQISDPMFVADVCASLETAIVDVLVRKTIAAAKKNNVATVLLAGGVAANAHLRRTLADAVAAELPGVHYADPSLAVCGDNAAMIAVAAYFHAVKDDFSTLTTMDVDPGWELGRK